MNRLSGLAKSLLELVHELPGTDIKLIIGGGFGIYLKADYVRRTGCPTLLREWPEARSTNDLDLFLRPELLIESAKLKPLKAALDQLGYQVVPGAEKYQFVKNGPEGALAGSVKIDFLTGPRSRFQGTRVKADNRRARPNPSVGIHAHPMEEALTLEQGLLSVSLEGDLGSGEPWRTEVFLPHPYTFLMMKLFAFKDRFYDAQNDFGRHHALDLYTILATTTEKEWEYALDLGKQHKGQPCIIEAGTLVSQYFSALDLLGMIRLRESPYCRKGLELGKFMSVLQEMFPV